MSNPYFTEDEADELDELDEDYEDAEADEATRRRRYRPVRTARPGVAPPAARPSGNYVTQVQLQSALTEVRRQITTNSAAIKTLEGRITSVTSEQARQSTALRKEIGDRKKAVEGTRGDVRQLRDLSAILPLLSQPSSITLTSAAGNLPAGTQVLVNSGSTLSTLLPFLLLSGIGGDSGSASSGGTGGLFGGDNSLMPLILILALSKPGGLGI